MNLSMYVTSFKHSIIQFWEYIEVYIKSPYDTVQNHIIIR